MKDYLYQDSAMGQYGHLPEVNATANGIKIVQWLQIELSDYLLAGWL